MKIAEILSEGMIKLPKKLLDALTNETITVILSYIRANIIKENGAKATEALKKFDEHYKQYKIVKNFNTEKKYTVKKVGDVDPEDLPDSYRKLLSGEAPHIDYEFYDAAQLKLKLHFEFTKKLGRAAAGQYSSEHNEIALSLTNIKRIDFEGFVDHFDQVITYLDKKITLLIGVIEHELTHYIQLKVLSRGSEKQIAGAEVDHNPNTFNKGTSYSKYATTNVEYDPHIKSEARDFEAEFNEFNKKFKLTGAEKEKAWKAFASFSMDAISFDDAAKTNKNLHYILTKPSQFFTALKQHDTARWKKAIKYLMLDLEKKLK